MHRSVLLGAAEGVGDLSSPCNTRLRLLLLCLCCLGRMGASTPQQQANMYESLSDFLTENIVKEIAAWSCCQLRIHLECLEVCFCFHSVFKSEFSNFMQNIFEHPLGFTFIDKMR